MREWLKCRNNVVSDSRKKYDLTREMQLAQDHPKILTTSNQPIKLLIDFDLLSLLPFDFLSE
jgi:hypothetical protein